VIRLGRGYAQCKCNVPSIHLNLTRLPESGISTRRGGCSKRWTDSLVCLLCPPDPWAFWCRIVCIVGIKKATRGKRGCVTYAGLIIRGRPIWKHTIKSNTEISHLPPTFKQAGGTQKHKHGPEASSALGFCREFIPSVTVSVCERSASSDALGTLSSRSPACIRDLVSGSLGTDEKNIRLAPIEPPWPSASMTWTAH